MKLLQFMAVAAALLTLVAGPVSAGVCSQNACSTRLMGVVTSGGAALDAVRALRQAGLLCDTVICVVDRGEGGAEAMAEMGVRLERLLDADALRLGR